MSQQISDSEPAGDGAVDGRSVLDKSIEFLRTCDRTWLGLTIAACLVLGFVFWALFSQLPYIWLGLGTWEFRSGDGYYSHGVLVPFIAGYIIYQRWPQIKDTPVRPGWIAIVPFLAMLWILWAANVADILLIRSYALILGLLSLVWFIAGLRWMLALSPSILYLLFALPVWTGVINNYTNPLQVYSTTVSYHLLNVFGYKVFQHDATTLLLDHFELSIAVPCSGLKLVVAVTAFTVFFMLIARLKWWANGLMAAAVLPLCLFINGLRIALIGIVGEERGSAAGFAFHDYSGYITLIVCFFIIFKFARLLGWKE
ncbi:MAG: exosortase/archaeosortase family protein [Armatimonadetes bacterium]|nr:exosortase/archaeosortase family protein [Armatimonadota bacterium]